MWLLGTAVAVLLGALAASWGARRRLVRLLAAEHDQRERDAHSARAEMAQLRRGWVEFERGLADAPVIRSAAAVVDNALRGLGSQETER